MNKWKFVIGKNTAMFIPKTLAYLPTHLRNLAS